MMSIVSYTGTLVNKLTMSKDAIILFSVQLFMMFIKSMLDSTQNSLGMYSINILLISLDMLYPGVGIVEMTGLSGGSVLFLCIFGFPYMYPGE